MVDKGLQICLIEKGTRNKEDSLLMIKMIGTIPQKNTNLSSINLQQPATCKEKIE